MDDKKQIGKLMRTAAMRKAVSRKGVASAASAAAAAAAAKKRRDAHNVDMAAELPLFLEKACCVKCGHDKVGTTHNEELPLYVGIQAVTRLTRQEHLERTCTRCLFRWAERPLDQGHDLELLAREAPLEQD